MFQLIVTSSIIHSCIVISCNQLGPMILNIRFIYHKCLLKQWPKLIWVCFVAKVTQRKRFLWESFWHRKYNDYLTSNTFLSKELSNCHKSRVFVILYDIQIEKKDKCRKKWHFFVNVYIIISKRFTYVKSLMWIIDISIRKSQHEYNLHVTQFKTTQDWTYIDL